MGSEGTFLLVTNSLPCAMKSFLYSTSFYGSSILLTEFCSADKITLPAKCLNTFVTHCIVYIRRWLQWVKVVNHNDFIVSTQNHMNSCLFLRIPCVHLECGMQVKKNDLTEHLEKECLCRLETCGFCKRQINLNKMKVG